MILTVSILRAHSNANVKIDIMPCKMESVHVSYTYLINKFTATLYAASKGPYPHTDFGREGLLESADSNADSNAGPY